MSFRCFLANKLPLVVFQVPCMVFVSFYLHILEVPRVAILLLIGLWIGMLWASFAILYIRQRNRFLYLQTIMDNLDKKYLLTQVVSPLDNTIEQEYFLLMRIAEKSMLEEIAEVRRAHIEYKEYVEQWIHEIKGPLTSLKLKCENDRAGALLPILPEIGQIENDVERTLFYARSESVEKDFIIQKVVIQDIVNESLIKNKHLLINAVCLDVNIEKVRVYSDKKWLEFIISQIIINAAKYRKPDCCKLKIYTESSDNIIRLHFQDNGPGISASDLPRVFEKGFTGINGRKESYATGLGLYLCKRLCEKLGHKIYIESTPGLGSDVVIQFAENSNK